jgi:thiol-disulfide isomerase/thioredoxin
MKKFFVLIVLILCVFVPQNVVFAENFPSFSSLTLDGEPISNEIFSKAKLTMVYIWWVGCGYCEEEMPMLGDLARNMPEGSQMVGFLIEPWNYWRQEDLGPAKAKSIMAEANADFPHFLENEELNTFADSIHGAPTVIFVDSVGEIVGKTIAGVYVDDNGHVDFSSNEKRLRDEIKSILAGDTTPGDEQTDHYEELPPRQEGENSSGGGCSVGFGIPVAALFSLGLVAMIEKKRRLASQIPRQRSSRS